MNCKTFFFLEKIKITTKNLIKKQVQTFFLDIILFSTTTTTTILFILYVDNNNNKIKKSTLATMIRCNNYICISIYS